jgi:hypothetical protein
MINFITSIDFVPQRVVHRLEERMGHISIWVRRTICSIRTTFWVIPVEIRLPPVILHVVVVQTILVIMLDVDVRAHFGLEPINVEGLFV